jgi:tetratricopeptide (TPR) repeat protein
MHSGPPTFLILRRFSSRFLINGSSKPRIRTDIIRNVHSLGTAYSQLAFDDCLLALAQPSPGGPRLILYDNVDDPELNLSPFLPQGESCIIIITSRNRSIGELCPDAHLELDVMSMSEAVELLSYQSNTAIEHSREAACAIAKELGCLPIALAQARSYMYLTKFTETVYLDRILSSKEQLLAQPVKNHPEMRFLSTYAAFNASFELLTVRHQKFLRLLSQFYWNDFPLALVILAAKHNFSDYEHTYVEHGINFHTGKAVLLDIFMANDEWNITDLDEMMISIQNHSLVTLVPRVDTALLQMHPLAHGWIYSCIQEPDRAKYRSAASLLLSLGSRDEYTPSMQSLASHVSHMSHLWNQLDVNSAQAFGDILSKSGVFEGALRLRVKVLIDLGKQVDAHTFSSALSAYAHTCSDLRRFNEAEIFMKAVLKSRQGALGMRHPKTIWAYNDLGLVYRELGRLSEAETLLVEVVKLQEETLGKRHRDTINTYGNLAVIYRAMGRLDEAEVLAANVLSLRKEMLGERHLETITASNNLANIYRNLKRLDEAEALAANVLDVRKELLGKSHPETIDATNNLALSYCSLGRLNEAETLQTEVLMFRRRTLGDRHPSTITASETLAIIYGGLDRPNDAEYLLVEILRLRKETLGVRHPDTLRASGLLSLTYRRLGRLLEATLLQLESMDLT